MNRISLSPLSLAVITHPLVRCYHVTATLKSLSLHQHSRSRCHVRQSENKRGRARRSRRSKNGAPFSSFVVSFMPFVVHFFSFYGRLSALLSEKRLTTMGTKITKDGRRKGDQADHARQQARTPRTLRLSSSLDSLKHCSSTLYFPVQGNKIARSECRHSNSYLSTRNGREPDL